MELPKVTQRPLWKTAIVVNGIAVAGLVILLILNFNHHGAFGRLLPRFAILPLGVLLSLTATWLYAKFAYGYGSYFRRTLIVLFLLLAAEMATVSGYGHKYDLYFWPFKPAATYCGTSIWTRDGYLGFHTIDLAYRWKNAAPCVYKTIGVAGLSIGQPFLSSISNRGLEISAGISTWFLSLLFLPYPLIAFIRDRKRFRQYLRDRHKLCIHCDYDLTGNVSGICPECGNPCKKDSNTQEKFQSQQL